MASVVGYSRVFALLVLVLITLQSDASRATPVSLSRRDELTTQVFSPTDFCRISGSQSVLVNSTMWIDGGDVTVQMCTPSVEGQSSNCSTWKDINNYILTVSFEKAFSAVDWPSLSYKAIRKPKYVPTTSRGVLWRNKLGNELYRFGGGMSGNETSPNYNSTADGSRVWSYATESDTWTNMSPALSSSWDLQHCSVPSLDQAFAFGTWGGVSGVYRSTMITLDTADSVSTREETINIPSGNYDKGSLIHLPVEGGDGVLLFIGGSVTPSSGPVTGNPDVPMSTVRLYDIASKTWFNQSTSTDATTGAFPNSRHSFCASLVSTGTKSFDIFMYGGDFNSIEDDSTATGLWILSIPSFRWFYFDDPDTRVRLSGSTCQVIGPHFIRFGGWNYYTPEQQSGSTCLNSFSIFNLNSFTWTDSFDPEAAAYISPSKVTAWNSKTEVPVGGWDNGVQELFAGLNSTSTASSTNSSTSSPSSSASTTPVAEDTPSKLPALLGGILGGLAIVILALVGILFLIKRKKKRNTELQSRFELAGETKKFVEMPGGPPQPMAELPGGEYAGSQAHSADLKKDNPNSQF